VDDAQHVLAIDASDNLYFIGSANFIGKTQSFIGKLNGKTGNTDTTFGKNSLPGYFAPYGRTGGMVDSNAFAVNVCNATFYDKNILTFDGKVIIGTTGQSHEQFSDGLLLKISESQDDSATGYTVNTGGA